MSIRMAASAAHDLQVSWLPRGARMIRFFLINVMVLIISV